MSRRIVLVVPDAAGRAIMDRVLASEGYAVDAAATANEARGLVAAGAPVELFVVDELGERGAVLADVRALRREFPSIPVIVIGALLSSRVMRELLRMRVADALAKPFTPDELREAVQHALAQNVARHGDALEHAAAVEAARRAIAEGRLDDAAPALRRAQATSPLDAEVTALLALVAELSGRDDDADRGYRAALALRRDEDTPPPDPHEGLARLAAYRGAIPVPALRPDRHGAPVRLVSEPSAELAAASPLGDAPGVVLLSLGLAAQTPGALFLRDGEGSRAFVLTTAPLLPDSVAEVLGRLELGAVTVSERTQGRVDLAEIERLRSRRP